MNRFDKEIIDRILEIREGMKGILVRRESTQLEFKRNFNFASLCEYGKILSSMSNNKGGYIVFGVTDKRPHELLGMSNEQFEKIDPSKISNLLDNHFSPRIIWDHHIESRNGVKIGFLYVESSREKPVICIQSGNRGEYNEGDIYYRYGGKTSRIKSSDLQKIISDRIDKENMKWQNLLGNIAKIPPSKISLLNIESGEFIGDENLIIDEDLLSKMKFIKDGEFNEVKDALVYKIVGKIQEVKGATIVEKKTPFPVLVHKRDIINSFFDEKCDKPITYLKQFPYENAYYLPFWFFIRISDLSIVEMETVWKELSDAKDYVRNKLIERLRNENVDKLRTGRIVDLEGKWYINNIDEYDNKLRECKSLNWSKTKSNLAIERSFILSLINNGCLKNFTKEFIGNKYRLIFEAISNLEKDEIIDNKEKIFMIMKEIYKVRMSSTYSSNIRKCICYIDYMLNSEDVCE